MTEGQKHSEVMPFPVLVADIGGTNARFSVLSDPDAPLTPFETAKTVDFPGIIEAAQANVLSQTDLAPKTAIMALAGPIEGDEVKLTNCDWVVKPLDLIDQLALDQVILINDFEAQALAVPSLSDEDLQKVGGGLRQADETKVVVGPGTGLGAAGLVYAGGIWVPVPGEGGHIDLGPVEDEEFELWPHIEKEHGRISGEALLCGRGLVRLYSAVASWRNETPVHNDPSAITTAALAEEPLSKETLSLFCRFLGRVAGDLALVFMARGGVYLAGGISQKIADFLENSEFRNAFVAKGPHDEIMAGIATNIVTHERPALMGMAAFARTPQNYRIKLDDRCWRRDQS